MSIWSLPSICAHRNESPIGGDSAVLFSPSWWSAVACGSFVLISMPVGNSEPNAASVMEDVANSPRDASVSHEKTQEEADESEASSHTGTSYSGLIENGNSSRSGDDAPRISRLEDPDCDPTVGEIDERELQNNSCPMQTEENDIGEVGTKLAPSSLKEPVEVTNGQSTPDDDDGWVDVIGSGDLMKKVISKGRGVSTRPQRGDIVTVNIVGTLEDGEEVEAGERKKITVGDAEVIQGLDLVIPLMELDEVCEVVVKPRLAFGKLGKEPDIPPNATMMYKIKMLSVEDEPEVKSLSYSERADIGNGKRERGNFWFSRGEFSCALQCYRRALEFLDEDRSSGELTDDLKELLENRIKVYNNMAAAQLKINAFDAALQSVNNVLKVQPENVKAIFRKGKILDCIGETNEAIATLKIALQLEPESKIIHQELTKLAAKQKSEVKTEREMYRRMLGQDKQASPKPSRKSTSSPFIKWGFFAGCATVAILSVVAYRHFHATSVII